MSSEAGAAFVAVVITLVVTAIVLICLFQIVKHRTQRQAQKTPTVPVSGGIESRSQTEGVQSHTRNISELSAEPTESEMRYEESRELMGRSPCQELPGAGSRRPWTLFRAQQELVSEEHDGILVSSPNRQDLQRYDFDEPDFGILNELALSLHEFV